jgi:hypothetical protein
MFSSTAFVFVAHFHLVMLAGVIKGACFGAARRCWSRCLVALRTSHRVSSPLSSRSLFWLPRAQVLEETAALGEAQRRAELDAQARQLAAAAAQASARERAERLQDLDQARALFLKTPLNTLSLSSLPPVSPRSHQGKADKGGTSTAHVRSRRAYGCVDAGITCAALEGGLSGS